MNPSPDLRNKAELIPKAFITTRGKNKSGKVRDFREAVGFQIREYRKDHMVLLGLEHGRDARWQEWFKGVEFDDQVWELLKRFDDDTAGGLLDRQSNIDFYIAVYYRLHAFLEDTSYADKIDDVVFGEPLRKRGDPVFVEDLSSSDDPKPLPPSFPVGIYLDDGYQKGRTEFRETRKALLVRNSSLVATAVLVQGEGGYGKTALAEEICLDEGIREAFTGGIYWLQFSFVGQRLKQREKGQTTRLADAVVAMLEKQYASEERRFVETHNGKVELKTLFKALPKEPILLIADDLWAERQARWVSELPEHVSVLATTRVQSLGRNFLKTLKIDRLTDEASFRLLTGDLEHLSPVHECRLRTVSKAFNGWPLLLRLARSTLRFRQWNATDFDETLSEFEEFTKFNAVTAWDDNEVGVDANDERRKFVGHCIDVGLAAVPGELHHEALLSLGVFHEETDIPFSLIELYWCELTKSKIPKNQITRSTARNILGILNDLSFLESSIQKQKRSKSMMCFWLILERISEKMSCER